MTVEENEELRNNIWDQIYRGGPQSVEQLAQEMQLEAGVITTVTDHEWFTTQDDLISIAIDGE